MAYAYAHTFLGWVETDAIAIAAKASVVAPAKAKRHAPAVKFRLGSHDLTFDFIDQGLGSDESPMPCVYFAAAYFRVEADDDGLDTGSLEVKKLANTIKLSKKFHFEFPDLPHAALHTVAVADPK